MSRIRLLPVTVLWMGCATGGTGPAIDVTPGEVTDALGHGADTGRVELKVTLDPGHIALARSRLQLANSASETRRIWFYDTPALAVFDAGTILRAREIDGTDDDSTVKLRPLTASDLPHGFSSMTGMKCEVDRTPAKAAPACSLTTTQDDSQIADVGDGKLAIAKLFSSDQEDLYAALGPGIALDALVALGPIPARVWTVKASELPAAATAELWYLPDTSETLELSLRVDAADADEGLAALEDFVAGRGLSLAADQETKTRRALELLAP